MLLGPDMHLSVRKADGQVMRPAAAMSCGTADQMYLALRLAMCRRLLPPDAPMVLDDALVNFDPRAPRAALRVLREEPRQILLFTCRPLTQERNDPCILIPPPIWTTRILTATARPFWTISKTTA